jgi:hypothetical protein
MNSKMLSYFLGPNSRTNLGVDNGKVWKWEDLVLNIKRPCGGKNDGTWVGWTKLDKWSLLCVMDFNMKRSGKNWWRNSPFCFIDILFHVHTYILLQNHIDKSLLIYIWGGNYFPFFFWLTFSLKNVLLFPTFNLRSFKIGKIFHESQFNILF